MANHAAAIKQNDAKRLFKAALAAGFDTAKMTIHPDGRIEATASFSDAASASKGENGWDVLIQKQLADNGQEYRAQKRLR